MKSILVAVDFGQNTASLCKYAIGLTRKFNSKVIFMYVYEKPLISTQGFADAMVSAFEKKMQRLIRSLKRSMDDFDAGYYVVEGDIENEIIKYAQIIDADLIFTGKTGLGRIAGAVLGNPSLYVMRNAPCPVISIPGSAKYKGISKLVYATDLTDESLATACRLIPLAKMLNSELVFLYVDLILGKQSGMNMQQLMKKIKSYVKYAKISGYVCDDINTVKGIEFFLQKVKADCLVLYAEHHSLIEKLTHNSVIKGMAFRAKIPLMIIHEEDILDVNALTKKSVGVK